MKDQTRKEIKAELDVANEKIENLTAGHNTACEERDAAMATVETQKTTIAAHAKEIVTQGEVIESQKTELAQADEKATAQAKVIEEKTAELTTNKELLAMAMDPNCNDARLRNAENAADGVTTKQADKELAGALATDDEPKSITPLNDEYNAMVEDAGGNVTREASAFWQANLTAIEAEQKAERDAEKEGK